MASEAGGGVHNTPGIVIVSTCNRGSPHNHQPGKGGAAAPSKLAMDSRPCIGGKLWTLWAHKQTLPQST
eukprot:961403-Amphidinium_carterae.1